MSRICWVIFYETDDPSPISYPSGGFSFGLYGGDLVDPLESKEDYGQILLSPIHIFNHYVPGL